MQKVIVAISGSSGFMYGIKALEILRKLKVETHLIVSNAAYITMEEETKYTKDDIISLADVVYPIGAIGSAISSGSFNTKGMLIAPCSMNTLACVANGISSNLITRSADVILKEKRKLVLMIREAPLSLVHIRNMEAVTLAGGIIFPPIPAFYIKQNTIDDIINYSVVRALSLLGYNYNIPIWGNSDINNKEI